MNSMTNGTKPKKMGGWLRTAGTVRLVPLLLLLALPTAVQAQFTLTTNGGALTITGYTGSGGTVVIPSATNGLPVTQDPPLVAYKKIVSAAGPLRLDARHDGPLRDELGLTPTLDLSYAD